MDTELLVATVLGVLVAGLMIATFKAQSHALAKARQLAQEQFQRTQASLSSVGINFDGRLARVLEEHEVHYLVAFVPSNYVLTRLAEMPDGRKYRFKSSANGKPSLTILEAGHESTVRLQGPFISKGDA